jgi:hypothetical protein
VSNESILSDRLANIYKLSKTMPALHILKLLKSLQIDLMALQDSLDQYRLLQIVCAINNFKLQLTSPNKLIEE